MRWFCYSLVSLALTGCATVSVVPSPAASVEAPAAEHLALRKASEAYVEMAETEGWVARSSGLGGLARVLINGRPDIPEAAPETYLDQVQADILDADKALLEIGSDIEAARAGLAHVNLQASAVIETGEAAERDDIIAFERALVSAQRSRRAFIQASEALAGDIELDRLREVSAETALAALETEIDRARRTADILASAYSGRPVAST